MVGRKHHISDIEPKPKKPKEAELPILAPYMVGESVDDATARRIAEAILTADTDDLFRGPKLVLDLESRQRITAHLLALMLPDKPPVE